MKALGNKGSLFTVPNSEAGEYVHTPGKGVNPALYQNKRKRDENFSKYSLFNI